MNYALCYNLRADRRDLEGHAPESWACITDKGTVFTTVYCVREVVEQRRPGHAGLLGFRET